MAGQPVKRPNLCRETSDAWVMASSSHNQPRTVPVVNITENRAAGRATTHRITCSLGQVLDISATGMRVVSRGKVHVSEDEVLPLTMHTPSGPIALSVQVIWIMKTGMLRHELGFRFVDITPKALANLEFTLKLCHIEHKQRGEAA